MILAWLEDFSLNNKKKLNMSLLDGIGPRRLFLMQANTVKPSTFGRSAASQLNYSEKQLYFQDKIFLTKSKE